MSSKKIDTQFVVLNAKSDQHVQKRMQREYEEFERKMVQIKNKTQQLLLYIQQLTTNQKSNDH